MSEANKALVRAFFDTADRAERIPESLCAPGFTAHIAGYPPMDLEAFQQFIGAFYAAFSGFAHDVEDVLAEDDRVAFRAVARATHSAAFMGIPASGKQISVPTIGMARIAGARSPNGGTLRTNWASCSSWARCPRRAERRGNWQVRLSGRPRLSGGVDEG